MYSEQYDLSLFTGASFVPVVGNLKDSNAADIFEQAAFLCMRAKEEFIGTKKDDKFHELLAEQRRMLTGVLESGGKFVLARKKVDKIVLKSEADLEKADTSNMLGVAINILYPYLDRNKRVEHLQETRFILPQFDSPVLENSRRSGPQDNPLSSEREQLLNDMRELLGFTPEDGTKPLDSEIGFNELWRNLNHPLGREFPVWLQEQRYRPSKERG